VPTISLSSVVVALAGSAASAAASTPKAPTWKTYFYPAVVGYHCVEAIAVNTAGSSGTETLTVTAVSRRSGATHFTVAQKGTTTVSGASVPSIGLLHYVITGGGELEDNTSSVNVGSINGGVSGVTNLGTVAKLVAGASVTSVLHVVEPLSASEIKDLQGVLPSGQTSLHATLTMASRGTNVATLNIPLGTLHHVLEVKADISHISFTNLVKGASSVLAKDLHSQFDSLLDYTTWYAPGLGPVQVDAAGLTVDASSCTR
jgi:hypothetical protein